MQQFETNHREKKKGTLKFPCPQTPRQLGHTERQETRRRDRICTLLPFIFTKFSRYEHDMSSLSMKHSAWVISGNSLELQTKKNHFPGDNCTSLSDCANTQTQR